MGVGTGRGCIRERGQNVKVVAAVCGAVRALPHGCVIGLVVIFGALSSSLVG